MQTSTTVTARFACSLERAFKSPMLCDVTKVHTGYGPMPRVTQCTDDATWGQVGGSRRVIFGKKGLFRGGESALDRVIERVENRYWRIEISAISHWALRSVSLCGEWSTTERSDSSVDIVYTYTVASQGIVTFPLYWIFTKVIWRAYMRHALENVRLLACGDAPYLSA